MCRLLQSALVTSVVWVPAKDARCLPAPPPNCLRKMGYGGREEPLVLPIAVGMISGDWETLPVINNCPVQKRVCTQAAMSEGRCWGRDWEEAGNYGEDGSCLMKWKRSCTLVNEPVSPSAAD